MLSTLFSLLLSSEIKEINGVPLYALQLDMHNIAGYSSHHFLFTIMQNDFYKKFQNLCFK